MVRRHGLRLGLLAAMAATIGCDRVTKHVAAATLAGGADRSWLGDTIVLTYAENPGAFLGLGADWPDAVRTTVFALAALTGVVVISKLWRRLSHAPAAVFGLALFAAGSVSNLVDRLAYGRVVDFLNVGVGSLRTGIFNIADVAILAGAALVLVFSRTPAKPVTSPHSEL
jgi:signal peptidase II